MGWFNNMRMKWKLLLGFGVILVLLGIVIAVAATQLAAIDRAESKALANDTLLILLLLGALAVAVVGFMVWLLNRWVGVPLGKAAQMIREMRIGELGTRLHMGRKDEIGVLATAMDQLADTLQDLAQEVTMPLEAAVIGELSTRGDARKFEGEYREIVQGVNDTLDTVIGPLNVATTYLERIARGDIPPRITDSYSGDFDLIRDNLNICIDAVDRLVSDTVMLTSAAVQGTLAIRADASKHQGDFRKVVQGMNDTLDAVTVPLNVSAGYLERIARGDIPPRITDSYNGDFNLIKNNLNICIDAVVNVVADVDMLTSTAVQGKLAIRADASKHQGDFRRIVQGLNDTLDAVIGPLTVTSNYVDRVSKGEIPRPIADTYKGDFDLLRSNLNTMVETIRGSNEELRTGFGLLASSSTDILTTVSELAAGAS